MLDSHPSFVDVALDIRNAFNSISRGAFFPLSHLTSLTCYRGLARCMRSLYLPIFWWQLANLTSDKPSIVITSSSGTRQGCPLGAQLFALGLHPHLCALARLVGENGAVIAMDADDIHLIGSPATVGLALSSLSTQYVNSR